MKLLVLVSICMCISQTTAVSIETKTKMSPKGNAIPLPQKTEMVYSHQGQQPTQTEFVPMQLMQKPLFVPQQQPAMIIIAQPALVPQNVIYGGHPLGLQQQLLNYFHTNPQAKYQLLYGGYQPHPTAQTYIPQAPLPASTVAAYQFVPSPVLQGYNHLVAAPSQLALSQAVPVQQPQHNQIQNQYVQPMQLNQLAHLAQMTAQQFGGQQFGAPIKSFPPIITGLENFTPEQQAQIKAQLGTHLGSQITTASTLPTTTAQYPQQISTQPSQSMSTTDYMQNNDKSNPQPAGSNYNPSLLYRTQYTKG